METLEEFFGNDFTGSCIMSRFWAYIPNPLSTDDTFVADILSDNFYLDYGFTFDLFRNKDACLDVVVHTVQ